MIFKTLKDLPTKLLRGEETQKLIETYSLKKQTNGYERMYGNTHPTGIRHGLWLKVIGNGEVLRISTIMQYNDSGHPCGPWGVYNMYGLAERRIYTDGSIIHVSKTGPGRNSPGAVISERNYDSKGRLHGRLFVRGKIEGNFSAGERNGTFQFSNFFKNTVVEKCRYKQGNIEGIITYRWRDGKLRCRLPLRKNVPHGWALYWTPQEELFCRKLFVKGRTVDDEIHLHPYDRGTFQKHDLLEHLRVLTEVSQAEIGNNFLNIGLKVRAENIRVLSRKSLIHLKHTASAEIGYVDPFFPKESKLRLLKEVQEALAYKEQMAAPWDFNVGN